MDERSPLRSPTCPLSALTASFPLADRRPVVLADNPCQAGSSGAGPEYAGIYLHAGYFDPKLGTFLSPDPIGVAGGMNAYGYGFGNPLSGSDRSGLRWEFHCDSWNTRTREGRDGVIHVSPTGECASGHDVWVDDDPNDPRDEYDPRDPSDPRNPRDPRDPRDPKDPKDPKDPEKEPPPPTTCQAGLTPTGVIVAAGVDGTIADAAGVMGQADGGLVFAKGLTVFGSGGLHAGLPATASFTRPRSTGGRNAFRGFGLGASAGFGPQFGVTNITRPSDLDGPFMTVNLGTPFGSGQFAFSSGDRGFVYTAMAGLPSAGFSISVYRTTTVTMNVVNRAGACR